MQAPRPHASGRRSVSLGCERRKGSLITTGERGTLLRAWPRGGPRGRTLNKRPANQFLSERREMF
jgi:hypothetical protein